MAVATIAGLGTLAAQSGALVTGLMSSGFQATAAKGVAGLEAHAGRYQGAVDRGCAQQCG